jgi:hypothetical protein
MPSPIMMITLRIPAGFACAGATAADVDPGDEPADVSANAERASAPVPNQAKTIRLAKWKDRQEFQLADERQ